MTRGKSDPEDEADRAGIRMCAESKPVWFDPQSQIAGASRVFSDNVVPGLLSLGDDDAVWRGTGIGQMIAR